jgi:aldehyde dehydrogenase (NAD+)
VLVNAIVQNAGQTCAAGSRVLIERSIHADVVARLKARFEALVTGPGAQGPDCGPLISRKQLDRVTAMVAAACDGGVRVAARAGIATDAPRGGFYFAPLLLDEVPPEHTIAQNEVFGPVLAAFAFDGEDEAIALANGTPYGLTASVWTRDGARQLRVAHRIDAGQVFINNYGAGGGIELPFGGMKHSGYGREKAFEGLRSFTTIKTIAIQHG